MPLFRQTQSSPMDSLDYGFVLKLDRAQTTDDILVLIARGMFIRFEDMRRRIVEEVHLEKFVPQRGFAFIKFRPRRSHDNQPKTWGVFIPLQSSMKKVIEVLEYGFKRQVIIQGGYLYHVGMNYSRPLIWQEVTP